MRVYALTTHCSWAMPPPKVAPICLTATLTTVTSSWITANPALAAISVAVCGHRPGCRVTAGGVRVSDVIMHPTLGPQYLNAY